MRIISGTAGGINLATPPSTIRPTMDRVRGAIFSSLADVVPGAKVLDLFAGSGAMGIEALSRGAASAVFVDSNPRCVACIRENLRRAGVEGSVQTMDALRYLSLYGPESNLDLILADPPYSKIEGDRDFAKELTDSPHIAASLAPGGFFVLERHAAGEAAAPEGLTVLRSKRYGGSQVEIYRKES
jgi:16S rRNA (guanine966-N2)-methyltransferase